MTAPVSRAPSGTGIQLSLLGIAGVPVSAKEGIEIDLLGLFGGIDFARPAILVPGLGRIGFSEPVVTHAP